MTKLIGYSDNYSSEYQLFAGKSYGLYAYQKKENYIKWLYKKCPITNKSNDFIIALSEDKKKVIGCVHKMRLLWDIQGKISEIPAIHNLMVSEDHRNGTGLMLIMKAIAGEEHAVMPGTIKPFSEIYKRLKYVKVNVNWYSRILRLSSGVYTYIKNQYLNIDKKESYIFPIINNKIYDNHIVTTTPDDSILQDLVKLLNINVQNHIKPYWNLDLLKWRFFHNIGPKHILIYSQKLKLNPSFAILSIGPRKGFILGRVLAINGNTSESLIEIISLAKKVTRLYNAHFLQVVSSDSQLNSTLDALGWRKKKHEPSTYFFHKNMLDFPQNYSFTGSFSDLGFEAIQ